MLEAIINIRYVKNYKVLKLNNYQFPKNKLLQRKLWIRVLIFSVICLNPIGSNHRGLDLGSTL